MIHIGIAIFMTFIGIYPVVPSALCYLKTLANADLAAFGTPEAFFAMLQLNLEISVLICMPLILCKILAPLPRFFPSFSNKAIFAFWLSSVTLFYAGVFFCFKITLPYGIKFLLGFETTNIKALISVDKFVSFCAMFLLGFGLVFQMPVAMVLSGRLFNVDYRRLSRHRREAILILTFVSAILTPTPDAMNMMLMAIPLYLLFEIGLLGIRFLN
ncbi:MAG: twin-arginine translocase subunit TatC [Proteobacteria bacterium]|nr:twin-arginine translocase subunit TatC [Pseudomonadota bacterium]